VQRCSATACAARADEAGEADLALVLQDRIFGWSQSGRTRAASSGGSWPRKVSASTGIGAGPQLLQPLPVEPRPSRSSRSNSPATYSRASPSRSSSAHGPLASAPRLGGDPGQVAVVLGQDVRLLVVEVLDPVLDPAQQRVRGGEPLGAGALHQAAGGELVERLQRRAGADLGELAAAHDEQQLDDELDLADAAARQLDVVGALRPPGGAALRLVAHLGVELAQPSKTP
jgi:hypothetical protein